MWSALTCKLSSLSARLHKISLCWCTVHKNRQQVGDRGIWTWLQPRADFWLEVFLFLHVLPCSWVTVVCSSGNALYSHYHVQLCGQTQSLWVCMQHLHLAWEDILEDILLSQEDHRPSCWRKWNMKKEIWRVWCVHAGCMTKGVP